MHRAARGGDSKAVIFFNIWERFVGGKTSGKPYGSFDSQKSHPETFCIWKYRRTFEGVLYGFYMD